ncbi:MAG: hypothetical protein KKA55_10600 [Proteobacteria bacterium]|nr:hypothetical protein [Pseudomonadota bacterium]MBU1595968.1 hypothetical protein [Pseudomonadota bacterium]
MDSQNPSPAQHYLNPLHVYCRLRDLGLPSPVARTLCAGYERVVYRPASGQNAPAATAR